MEFLPLFQLVAVAGIIQVTAISLQHGRFTYPTHPHLFAGLYAFGGIFIVAGIPPALQPAALHWHPALAWLWMISVAATLLVNRLRPIPLGYRARHRNSYFLDFNLTFILVKICDIFFQQSFLLAFILWAYRFWPSLPAVTTATILLFAVGHLPLIVLQKKVSMLHVLGAILFVGLVPFLILQTSGGFWLAYTAHWLFYIATRLMLAFRPIRQSILGRDLELEAPKF